MDYLDAIFNFLNIFDNSHYIKKDYNALIDKNEYLGKRILSFLFINFRYSNRIYSNRIYSNRGPIVLATQETHKKS